MVSDRKRRRILKASAALGLSGLAGCEEIAGIPGEREQTRGSVEPIQTELSLALPADVNGDDVIVSGKLSEADTGEGITDQVVGLFNTRSGLIGDKEDERLAAAQTDEKGHFEIAWGTSDVEGSKVFDTYAMFSETDQYLAARAPPDKAYPIQIAEQPIPFDFETVVVPIADTIIDGFGLTYYVLTWAKDDFMTDPPADMPAVSLTATELPAQAYELEPNSERLLTNFPGYINPAAYSGYAADLTIEASALQEQTYTVQVEGAAFGFTRETESRELRVVDASVAGVRYYTYDLFSKMVDPYWWRYMGAARLVRQGVTKPIKYIADLMYDVVTSLLSGDSPTSVALQQLSNVFQETLLPAFETLIEVTTGEVLDQAATDAKIDHEQFSTDLRQAPELIANEQQSEAEDVLSRLLTNARAWKEAVAGDETPATAARTVLESMIRVFEADLNHITQTPTIERITPVDDQVTVAPNTTLLFEVAARRFAGDHVETKWFIDGERRDPLGPFHAEYMYRRFADFFQEKYSSTGRHEIRAVVYSGGENERLGTVKWTVHVTEDAGDPPSGKRVSPDQETVKIGPEETLEFIMSASDPDGDLHRVIWWIAACDILAGMDTVGGAEAKATIRHEPTKGCPLFAWIVDERGMMTTFNGWRFEKKE